MYRQSSFDYLFKNAVFVIVIQAAFTEPPDFTTFKEIKLFVFPGSDNLIAIRRTTINI